MSLGFSNPQLRQYISGTLPRLGLTFSGSVERQRMCLNTSTLEGQCRDSEAREVQGTYQHVLLLILGSLLFLS